MNNILLISEKYVKENSGLDDNVYGKFLLPAIREAQDINLQSIIGTSLLDAICQMVNDDTISDDDNFNYKYLLDKHIQPYLLYCSLANTIPLIGSKLTNMGAIISNDEHVENLSKNDKDSLISYYTLRSDHYARQMQKYLVKNRIIYPELKECDCDAMQANLKSAATTPIWLGGARGQRK